MSDKGQNKRNPSIDVDSQTASKDPRAGSKSFSAAAMKFKMAGRKGLMVQETTGEVKKIGHATNVFLPIPLQLPPELKTCSTTNDGAVVDDRMVGADDADRSGNETRGDGADDESIPSVPMEMTKAKMDLVQDQTDVLAKAAKGCVPGNDESSTPITAFPAVVPAAVLALLASPLSMSEHAGRKQLMRQKRKKEQFILKCKDGRPLSKPLEEIKISADYSTAADC